MISKREKIERHAIVRNALANQRIEGVEPDAQVIKDAEKWACGEISIAEAIANFKAKLQDEL
ncbi:hypothetical protein V8G57_13775 [Collimonas sp. H4R21]|uniref:Antitoxin VbhA domain-containing protein n=1 Tax=Collimonas rhizosphaerae TaxID=3126357 RepID=A0ABU9PWU6_9BURK